MRNKVFLLLIMMCAILSFSIPEAVAEDNTIPVTQEVSVGNDLDYVQNDTSFDDPEIEPINTQKVKETVVPNPQSEGLKVIILFFKTMLGVVFSACVIYFGIVFVNKFWASAFINQEFEELESLDLATPQNKHEALRSFLNRTK
ncbi:hypothetical protein IJ670_08355 [bacterium]|nr:hypothetical protein [bacterium]